MTFSISRIRHAYAFGGLLAAAGLYHVWFHISYTLDDAYISYRYSRNLARGLGLVYNPGEYVKGYSNTLHTLLMSIPEHFGHDPNSCSKALGLLAYATLAWFALRLYADAASPETRERGLWSCALLATCTPLAVHCASGLETGPYTALVFAGYVRRLEEQSRPNAKAWSALLLSAAVLSRPEGGLLFAALAFHDLCLKLWKREIGRNDVWFYALPPLAYAGELAWSAAYYGDAFPQTYHAKLHATQGVVDAVRALATGVETQLRGETYLTLGLGGSRVALPLIAAVSLTCIPRARRRQNTALLCLVLAQIVFIARAADDWAPAFRFGVPMLPALIVLTVELIGIGVGLAGRFERVTGWIAISGLLCFALPQQIADSREIQATRYVNAENKLAEGRFFATLAPAGSTLSSFDIGGQGYGAGGLDVVDTGGLTTRETAGCKDRTQARCKRYAALVLPELVRLHGNPRRDGYVGTSVVREAPYIALNGGRYLLRREIVVPSELPASARRIAPAAVRGAELIAVDVPDAMTVQQEREVTLFWRRTAAGPDSLSERRLEWAAGSARYSARASDVFWKSAGSSEAWREGELFADRITLRAPHLPARYALQVVAGGSRIQLGSVAVLDAAASRAWAAESVKRARELNAPGAEQGKIALLERAAQLSTAEARDAYQAALVRYAARRRAEIERVLAADPVAALRAAQVLKVQLHRAYWQSREAGSALRREIDANAALRRGIVQRELVASR